MKRRITSFLIVLVAVLAWSSSAYARCTNAQFSGTWDIVFSDGNSCSLVVNKEGEVLTEPDRSLSTCFDPFRGETAPDSGTIAVTSDCVASFDLVVEGLNIEMYGRIAKTRDTGAGFYLTFLSYDPLEVVKGSFNMIRVK